MTINLEGKWRKGLAYDIHTLASNYFGTDENGRDKWENTRSAMGELLYKLKYNGKRENLPAIVTLVVSEIKGLETFDAIVPIPPSKPRGFQPVTELAEELGRRVGVRVMHALEKANHDTQLKDMTDIAARRDALQKTMRLKAGMDFSGQKVLLLDDLYRSGATLERAMELLQGANAADVCVLCMTKTRSNR